MRRFVVAALGLSVSACVKPAQFTQTQYKHDEYPYLIQAEGADLAHPLGDDWRLDNYKIEENRPVELKRGADYTVDRSYDVDGDGDIDVTENEPFFDLLFDHQQIDASIWVRTVPISTDDAKKELRVFAERYVQAASGAGSVLVRFGAEGPVGIREKRQAARTLSSGKCTVSGRPAYTVDFEVANVDELQLSKDARWIRARLVIVSTPYLKEVEASQQRAAEYPVLMLVGASASPADFAGITDTYGKLLDRIVVRQDETASSTALASTCGAPTAASAGGELPTSEGALPVTTTPAPAGEQDAPAEPAAAAPAATPPSTL